MLESTIPINLVMKREGKEHPTLDKIVLVACAPTYVHQLSQQISTYLLLQIKQLFL